MNLNPYFLTIKRLEDLQNYSFYTQNCLEILSDHMTFDVGHDKSHLMRVARHALYFGKGGNQDVLVIASLLHDLVNLKKDNPNRHKASTFSADLAISLLEKDNRLSSDVLEQIYHAIQAHSYSANITALTLEAKAVQDADRIESLGAIGIARVFSVVGGLRGNLFDAEDPLAKNRALDDKRYALDHFYVKLLKIKDDMKTEKGKELATIYTAKMHVFIKQLIDEIG